MGKMRKRRKFFKLFSCLGRSQTDDVVPDDGISCSASSPAVAAACSVAADDPSSGLKAGAGVASCPHDMFRYTWSTTVDSHAPVSMMVLEEEVQDVFIKPLIKLVQPQIL